MSPRQPTSWKGLLAVFFIELDDICNACYRALVKRANKSRNTDVFKVPIYEWLAIVTSSDIGATYMRFVI